MMKVICLQSERDDARDVCDTIDDELEEAKKQLRVAEEKIATLQQGHGDLVKRLEKHEVCGSFLKLYHN